MSFDLDAAQIRELLDKLDQRLKAARIAATVYVVGGAANSLHLPDADRRTQDIDGITADARVANIVAQMADDLGLPEGWLSWLPSSRFSPGSRRLAEHGTERTSSPWRRCST